MIKTMNSGQLSPKACILSTILLVLVSNVASWHSFGHQLVAMIAKHDLLQSTEGKLAYTRAVALLRPLDKWTIVGVDSFVECADWPDKIRQDGFWLYDTDHYGDMPYFKDGIKRPVRRDTHNITERILDAVKSLKSKARYTQGKSTKLFSQSIIMRYLIHIMGDLHQPLHAVEGYDAKRPYGDMGGNTVKTNFDAAGLKGVNLHFVWDHFFHRFEKPGMSPLSQEQYDYMAKTKDEILLKFNRDTMKENMSKQDPQDWALESLELAKSDVYEGIGPKGELSEEYIAKGVEICEKRLALAGLRLADIIKDIYKQ